MGLRERKIFRVLLVIQTILVLPLTLIALGQAITNRSVPQFDFILVSGLFLLFSLNGIYILYAVNVLKKVTGANPINRTPHIISCVLHMLGLVAIIIVFCYGFHEEFLRDRASHIERDNTGKFILLYLLILILIGISIAIMQVRLIKAFSKLNKKELEEQITHIGNAVE